MFMCAITESLLPMDWRLLVNKHTVNIDIPPFVSHCQHFGTPPPPFAADIICEQPLMGELARGGSVAVAVGVIDR